MNPSDYLTKFLWALSNIETTDYYCDVVFDFDESVERIARILREVHASKKKVMLVGNSAEASIASHAALDLWKCEGVRAVTFSDPTQLTALANDCGVEFVFSVPVKVLGDPGDVVFALSCSGESENVLRAAKAARDAGYLLVTLTGLKPANALRKMGAFNFYVPDSTYGVVESVHALIMHCIIDCIFLPKED